MTAHQAANQLLEPAAPDFGAYSAKLKEATAHMVEAHVAMAKSAVAARGSSDRGSAANAEDPDGADAQKG